MRDRVDWSSPMRSASALTVSSSAEAISAIRPNWEKETPASAMRSSMNCVARRAASRRFQPAQVSSAERASERSVLGDCLGLLIDVCIYISCRYMESAMKPILIVGSYLSPYVRKVLACLEVKGMAYEVDHIVPFFGDDRFSKLSPLRRIPVLVDGDLVLSDSSVICQYLEDKQPDPALFPRDIADRARARWLEEFADTRMGDVFIWRFFNQIAIRPSVWGEKGDREMVDRTLKEEIPTVLDYLEGEAPAEGFRFGSTLSVADIAIAAFFRNAGWVRFQIDAARWPKTAGWIGRTLASPAFAKLAKIEDAVLRVPIAEQRAALKAMGAPISAETYAGSAPRRGVMPI